MASAAGRCPECGHQFRPERRHYAVVAGELQELSAAQLQQRQARQERKREQLQATTVEDLTALGQRRGLKNPRGWARHVLAGRQGKGHWSRVR
jgi:hypothetical protein